jgi:hypothetical protein
MELDDGVVDKYSSPDSIGVDLVNDGISIVEEYVPKMQENNLYYCSK